MYMENVRKDGGLIFYPADSALTTVCTNNHQVAHMSSPDCSGHLTTQFHSIVRVCDVFRTPADQFAKR